MTQSLFIRNAHQLLTLAGPDCARAGEAQRQIGLIENGAVYCQDERIVAVGTTNEVLNAHPQAQKATVQIDATGHAVLPGLVDCHAHPVFAGDRSDEYALRLAGKSYREIYEAGGGIRKSVRLTQAASPLELLSGLKQHLDGALKLGTTTMEAKSGYGLNVHAEGKMLEVIRAGNGIASAEISESDLRSVFGKRECFSGRHPVELVPTLLFGHAIPSGMTAEDMVMVVQDGTPKLAPLAEFADVFCERGIFEVDQSRRMLQTARNAGLKLKVHAEELCLLGGAKLAAELGAISADHLLYTDDETIAAMRAAGTIAVLLPGTPFVLREKYADARRWIEQKVPVAVATDFNPNCYCESLPFAFALAVYEMKMTPAEALTAITINAAAAIDRAQTIGSLKPGKQADIVILRGPSYLHLGYHIGGNPVLSVVKRGRVVVAPD